MKSLRNFLLIIATFVLFGCGSGIEIPTASNGKSAESFAPMDPSFVFSMNFSEGTLRDKAFFMLKDLYDQDGVTKVSDFFKEYGLDVKSDIFPLFLDKGRLLVTFNEPIVASEDISIELYDASQQADMLLIVQHSNMEKASEIYRMFSERNGWVKIEIAGEPALIESESHMYLALKNDFFVISNAQEVLADALKRYAENGDSLLSDSEYEDALSHYDENQFGYMYIRTGGTSVTTFADVGLAGLSAGLYHIYGVRPEDGGFAVEGYSQFDKEILSDLKLDLDDFGGDKAYMYEFMRGDAAPMMYTESYNISRGLALTPAFSDQKVKDTFRAYFGEEIEDMLYPLLDEGFSMAVHNTGFILPALSLSFDAGDDTEIATSFYTKLDAQISGLATVFQNQEGFDIVKENVDDFTVLKVSIIQLQSLVSTLFPGVTFPRIELAFGLEDSVFHISTLQNFSAKKSGDLGEKFEGALDYLDASDAGMSYVDFEEVSDYLGVLSSAVKSRQSALQPTSDALPEDEEVTLLNQADTQVFDQINNIVSKLSYFVVGNSVKGGVIEMKGFLQLAK